MTERISPHYLELNRQLHAKDEACVTVGHEWASHVENVATFLSTTSILDYGCGKGALAQSLPGLPIKEYDPAIRGKDADPGQADLVVCTDVLERVEPEHLDSVLDHLQAVTRKAVLLVISCGKGKRPLPDGRNEHLSAHNPQFWIDHINRRWLIAQENFVPPTLFIIAKRPPEADADAGS